MLWNHPACRVRTSPPTWLAPNKNKKGQKTKREISPQNNTPRLAKPITCLDFLWHFVNSRTGNLNRGSSEQESQLHRVGRINPSEGLAASGPWPCMILCEFMNVYSQKAQTDASTTGTAHSRLQKVPEELLMCQVPAGFQISPLQSMDPAHKGVSPCQLRHSPDRLATSVISRLA